MGVAGCAREDYRGMGRKISRTIRGKEEDDGVRYAGKYLLRNILLLDQN